MYTLYRALTGLLIGILIAILLNIFVGLIGDAQTTAASLGGPVWITAAAILIGVAYALLFEPLPNNSFENISTGLVLGLVLWFVWAISLQPVVMGAGNNWNVADAVSKVPQLIMYLIQGGLIGFIYGVVFQRLGRPLNLYIPAKQPVKVTKRVAVIGGGYAGVEAAQALEKELKNHPEIGIYLISQTNYLIHTPMLSEVSSSAVNAQNISPPLRSFFDRVRVVQGEVSDIDLENKELTLFQKSQSKGKKLRFDHLVMTTGSVPNYFGNADIEQQALPFKTLGDAIYLRNQVIEMFERADVEPDPAKKKQLLTFVVAGGGFAGVELLGGLNDFARGITFYYPNVDPADVRTVLVHSRDRILPELSEELGEFAREKLAERGVEFQLNVRVTGARPGAVLVGDDEIPSYTFVWTAGNKPGPVMSKLGIELTKRGQIEVDAQLRSAANPSLWAAGDCAQVPDLITGGFAPPTAQHASREGKVVGYNVAAAILNKPLKNFEFETLGSLAALGHQLAVAEVFGRRFSGFLAWLLWRGIYLSKLPTLQKQVRVLLDWILDVFFPPDIVQTIDIAQIDSSEVA